MGSTDSSDFKHYAILGQLQIHWSVQIFHVTGLHIVYVSKLLFLDWNTCWFARDITSVEYRTPFAHRKGQRVFASLNFAESLPEGIGHTRYVGSC